MCCSLCKHPSIQISCKNWKQLLSPSIGVLFFTFVTICKVVVKSRRGDVAALCALSQSRRPNCEQLKARQVKGSSPPLSNMEGHFQHSYGSTLDQPYIYVKL